MTRYAVLTPPGTGAIAVLALAGEGAWATLRRSFRPAGKPLPAEPTLYLDRFGTLGDEGEAGDEVVVVVRHVTPELLVEVHCHGGPQVVAMLSRRFGREGCVKCDWPELNRPEPRGPDSRVLPYLARATTLRNASILLDQYHGAFRDALLAALPAGDAGEELRPESKATLDRLCDLAGVGAHLVEPWNVVLFGAPNVGKSSLLNALAGYQRSVVTPIAGTTRDPVTADLVLDGVAIRLTDTAGLRATADALEAEGVRRAEAVFRAADLRVRVLDVTAPPTDLPAEEGSNELVIWNKVDAGPVPTHPAGALGVSAETGEGVTGLIRAIVSRLEPATPRPGEAVPYTPELAARLLAARAAGYPIDFRTSLAAFVTGPPDRKPRSL